MKKHIKISGSIAKDFAGLEEFKDKAAIRDAVWVQCSLAAKRHNLEASVLNDLVLQKLGHSITGNW